MHTMFEVKRSKVNVTRPINAETENVSPTNFKLGRRLEHALSTDMASYKGLVIVKLGYCTWAGDYRVGRTHDGHTTCFFRVRIMQYVVYSAVWRMPSLV